RTVAPDLGDLPEVQLEFRLVLEDGKPFGIRLHHSVFDAVVDHLHEVARADWADAAPALVTGRSECFKNGLQAIDDFFIAADHHAVAFLEAPHAAAGAAIDIVDAF